MSILWSYNNCIENSIKFLIFLPSYQATIINRASEQKTGLGEDAVMVISLFDVNYPINIGVYSRVYAVCNCLCFI